MTHRASLVMPLAAVLLGLPAAAPAQESGDQRQTGLERIVVTAEKVEEDIQQVPVSITAFDATELQQRSIVETKDLSFLAPNLRFENVPGSGSTATISIRGQSQADLLITGDPSVGVYIDGVYNARLTGGNFNFIDVERVEVLKGPQGTLYGKNTPGGAINIWSRRPDGTFGGYARATVGEDGRTDAEAAMGFPILEGVLSGRIAVLSQDRDGYIENKVFPGYGFDNGGDVQDNNNQGLRASLLWTFGEHEILAQGYWAKQRLHNPNPHVLVAVDPTFPNGTIPPINGQSAVVGDPVPGAGAVTNIIDPAIWQQVVDASDSETTFLNDDGREDIHYRGGNLTGTFALGSSTQLRYILGHREFTVRREVDSDGSPFVIFNNGIDGDPNTEKSHQTTNEVNLSGMLGERLEYVVGGYHFLERSSNVGSSYFDTAFASYTGFPGPGFGLRSFRDLVSKIQNWGAFGQGTYHLTDRLAVTAGLRSTYEQRRVDFKSASLTVDNLHDRWDALSWTAGLEYQLSDDLFGYAKASRGYRSGGFNGRASDPTQLPPFDEEFVTTYEAGVKADWLDRRMRTNLALFFSKYKDQQSTSQVPCSAGACSLMGMSRRLLDLTT